MRPLIIVTLLLSVTLMVGCGGRGFSKGFPVGGKVIVKSGKNSKPLPGGLITLTAGSFTCSGDTLADGSYNVLVKGGVPAGTYKVSVTANDASLIDPKYGDPETSGLTCEVKEATRFDITLEPPQKE